MYEIVKKKFHWDITFQAENPKNERTDMNERMTNFAGLTFLK